MDFSNRITCVSRAVVKAQLELSDVTNLIYAAVEKNYSEFKAQSGWDVWPVEINMEYVVVLNEITRKHYMAKYEIKNNEIVFTDVQEVVKQWKTVNTVERSEEPDIYVQWCPSGSFGNILMRKYE